jgi:hypothetical protein
VQAPKHIKKIKIISVIVFLMIPLKVFGFQNLCPKAEMSCSDALLTNNLFNSDAKIAANYIPVLPLRAFAHAEIYKEKKRLAFKREFFYNSAAKAYATMNLNIEVKGKGFLGREIIATGTLNEHKVEYFNETKPYLPRNVDMRVIAKLDGIRVLELDIASDGTKMTNNVKGKFFNKEVNYSTNWRNTKGVLAGLNYEIYAEGVEKEKTSFRAISKGRIQSQSISGSCQMIESNLYRCQEQYGPISIKTEIKVL